ncbi:MAG: GAF domain-containing protein [Vicinamibacterales bacterium]
MAAINSVALAIGRFATLDQMLDHALGKVLEVVQTDAGSVYLLDEEHGELSLAVSQGLSDETRKDFDRLKLGEGLSGRVARDGTPIVLRSLKDDPRLTRMSARSEGFCAFASVPLLSNFKTYGTLNVHSRDDRLFSEQDVQLLTSMAAQIGLAVANTRLYLELQASERKFRGLVENAEDLIYVTDAAGRFKYVNGAAATLLGLDPSVLCDESQPVLSLVHPDDLARVTAAMQQMLAGTIMRAFEFRMVRADSGVRWFSQTNVPLRDEIGVIVGMQGMAHDITPRRVMGERVKQAERLADLGRMAAQIAHEIRNPLGAIVNSISVLRRQEASADPRLLKIVTEEADRLDGIIRQFLLFARPPSRTPRLTDMMALIADTVALFEQDDLSAGVTVRVAEAPALSPALVDPKQLRQVLWNLLKNAAEAMEGQGRIDIRVGVPEGGESLVISVADVGSGLASPAEAFEPFYTTRAQGTGLGLAVVSRIVADHGGRIWAENLPVRGACFSIELPFGIASAMTAEPVR